MADYYPLLAKAVAGLPNSTPDARRSIYERARKALYGQLRSLDPPVPESVVEREARALEEAIARLEVEISLEAPADATAGAEAPPAAPDPAPEVSGDAEAEIRQPVAPAPPPQGSEAPQRADTEVQAEPPPVSPEPGRPDEGVTAIALAHVPDRPDETSAPPETPEPQASVKPAVRARKETRRPLVPRPAPAAPVPKRLWIVGGTVGIVITLVAIMAYVLRDRPEDVARPFSPPPSSGADAAAGGKIADRIGSGETKPEEPSPPVARRAERSRAEPPAAEPPAAVARRAALLVEAPEEQTKVKTYLGTVVWRTDNVSSGAGAPLGTAVRAEIDIPEEKLQAVMTLQKNVDATLPASHTMKLRFVIQPGGPLGSVKHINVPQMRREDSPTGEPLNGVPVPVMENSFLVGLARGNAEATNIELVKSREWLDVPILFANGRIAKLTFEKGTSGQKAIEDALASWQRE